jgi:hypothetical protein
MKNDTVSSAEQLAVWQGLPLESKTETGCDPFPAEWTATPQESQLWSSWRACYRDRLDGKTFRGSPTSRYGTGVARVQAPPLSSSGEGPAVAVPCSGIGRGSCEHGGGYFLFIYFAGLEFKLRVSHLQSRLTTT